MKLRNKLAYPIFIALFGASILLMASCKDSKQKTDTKAETTIQFKQTSFNFGEIAEGEIVSHTFYFKNTGTQNLVIKNIESGCGCTTVDYDKLPVKPGKEGKIEIAFNSSGRYGKQYKEIRIFANVPEKEIILNMTGQIK